MLEGALAPVEAHPNSKDPERRLRVGFVSGDLYDHAIAHFLLPVWQHLDTDRIELFAYSTAGKADEVTARFKQTVHHWFDAGSVGDEPLADRIRHDRIDVLFDLSGHTAYHRLGVFARKPAPVQISWCGYPGTTGLTRMDYFFSDTVFSPPGLLDGQFTEKLLLPRVSGAFGEAPDMPPLAPSPAAGGAPFTFGSFNRVSKLTPGTLALWAEVLGRVPQARMRLGAVGEGTATGSCGPWSAGASNRPVSTSCRGWRRTTTSRRTPASISCSTPRRTRAAPPPATACGWGYPP